MHPILDPQYKAAPSAKNRHIPALYEIEIEKLASLAGKSKDQIIAIILNLAIPEVVSQVSYELSVKRDDVEASLKRR